MPKPLAAVLDHTSRTSTWLAGEPPGASFFCSPDPARAQRSPWMVSDPPGGGSGPDDVRGLWAGGSDRESDSITEDRSEGYTYAFGEAPTDIGRTEGEFVLHDKP